MDKIWRGNKTNASVPIPPSILQMKRLSHTRFCASCLLPEATAEATRGAVMFGKNEIKKKSVNEAWFAAAWPASAKANPKRPTQKVSTALTIGTTPKLIMEGTAVAKIVASRESPFHGRASLNLFRLEFFICFVSSLSDSMGRGKNDSLGSITSRISSSEIIVLSSSLSF